MISVLSINLKTNVDGDKSNTLFKVSNSSNTIDDDYSKLKIPDNTLLFSDLVPIEMKYFPDDIKSYLESLLYVENFNEIISNKLKDYKKSRRKEYKITSNQAENEKIPYYNIYNILEKLFKTKNAFFYYKDKPLTIINYFWNGGYLYNEKIVKGTKFKIYEINIIVELDNRSPDKIDKNELKKFECKNQKEKIKRIWSSLNNVNYQPTMEDKKTSPAIIPTAIKIG